MEYKLSEQELKDLMHRTWLKAKKFYSGKTDEYFYDHFESEKKQLTLTDVVGQSEQLVCDNKCEWTRYPKDGVWYDGCVKCGKEIAN